MRNIYESADQTKVKHVIAAYRRARDTVTNASDLSPNNPLISRDLSALVGAVSMPFNPAETRAILQHDDIAANQSRMWERLSQAESAMELYDSAVLSGRRLQDFRYFENYDGLVDAELEQLGRPRLAKHESIAFVGAGPLPLSAILMHQKTGSRIVCLDNDPEAAALGRDFIKKSGLSSDAVQYRCTAGEHYDYSANPIVFIASLVGDKNSVMRQIHASPGNKTLAIRSSEGVHKLLYSPLEPQAGNGLNLRFRRGTKATPQIINTTLFFTMPGKQETSPSRPDHKALWQPAGLVAG
ncbi:MAG: nicotianamine synthase family protein [Alphaproteobacteria bacterium]